VQTEAGAASAPSAREPHLRPAMRSARLARRRWSTTALDGVARRAGRFDHPLRARLTAYRLSVCSSTDESRNSAHASPSVCSSTDESRETAHAHEGVDLRRLVG